MQSIQRIKKLLEGLAGLSEKYHAPVYTHNSETKREVEECRQRYGKSPTQLFEEMGLYRYGGGGYHCIWFDDEDIDILQNGSYRLLQIRHLI